MQAGNAEPDVSDARQYLDWKEWREESFGQCDTLTAGYFAAETGIRPGNGARVLEIGFGNGSFIGWAHRLGVDIYGVELNPMLVERCELLLGRGRAFVDIEDSRLRSAGAFTHIVAFDVAEHIPQQALPQFLSRLKSLLAEGGRIILRFPNGDSPFGRIYQHGDPTHVTTIGRRKLLYWAQQTGLSLSELRAPRLPRRGVGVRRLLQRSLVLGARFFVERVVGILYFGGPAIPLDPNYTAVLVHDLSGRHVQPPQD